MEVEVEVLDVEAGAEELVLEVEAVLEPVLLEELVRVLVDELREAEEVRELPVEELVVAVLDLGVLLEVLEEVREVELPEVVAERVEVLLEVLAEREVEEECVLVVVDAGVADEVEVEREVEVVVGAAGFAGSAGFVLPEFPVLTGDLW